MTNEERCLMRYNEVKSLEWKEVLNDTGYEDWRKHWFLDGDNARVYNSDAGMEFYTGARYGVDADHGVLWTKESFSGDLKLTFDYWRLDNAVRCVNIIYLMATGSGEQAYEEDITEWSNLRKIPTMATYINHMNLYHISYAAFDLDNSDKYIRARQYKSGEFSGTNISPDYDPQDYFGPMELHHITVIKKEAELFFYTSNSQGSKLCTWRLDGNRLLKEGRIGLRQMYTRNARYANIKVETID